MRLPILALIAALLWFVNLEHRKLIDPDEGRYAEIPREMVASGDWVTPRLNGLKYFEKPALQYWATAAAFRLFGEHHWTARLWSALTGFLGILTVYWSGRRLFGPEAGINAALVLASSLGYLVLAQINSLDMALTFFLGLALSAFLVAQHENSSDRERRVLMLVAWAAVAGGVLTKGLVALVLPGLAFAAYVLVERDWRLIPRLHPIAGLALLLALTVPWFAAVSLRNPEFFDFFFVHEHFGRFLTKAHERYQPWWWFFPVLAIGALPWIVSMGAGLAGAWRGDLARSLRPRRFLLLWAVLIFVFFSLSGSKLHAYILPMFPALALLAGECLARADSRALTRHLAPGTLLWALLLGLALYLGAGGAASVRPLDRAAAWWATAAGAAGLMGGLVALRFARSGARGGALTVFAAGGLLAGQLLVTAFDAYAPERSGYVLAQAMRPYAREDVPVYSVGTYEQTIPFYLGRTVTLVAYAGELTLGVQQEPDRWVPDLERFAVQWRAAPEALAVMAPAVYDKLSKEGLPMEKIAGNLHHVVVRKP